MAEEPDPKARVASTDVPTPFFQGRPRLDQMDECERAFDQLNSPHHKQQSYPPVPALAACSVILITRVAVVQIFKLTINWT